jgi:tRNA-modifying protein YgfZ
MTTYLFDRSAAMGRIEMRGKDRLTLLHNMSTNDVARLGAWQARTTVLTTALARIIDHVTVCNLEESSLLLTNYPDTVRGWLQKHIFFRDEVKLRDTSAESVQLELHGDDAASHLRKIGADVPAAQSCRLFTFGGAATLVTGVRPLVGEGYTLVVAPEERDALIRALDLPLSDEATYEHLRIQAGIPGANHELTEDYIPLEAGLWDAVSFSKGCYIGQEIIARMESRNKLAKTLIGVRLVSGNAAQVGDSLRDGDRQVGALTSVFGADALGFIKPDAVEMGKALSVVRADQTIETAEIVFAAKQPQLG